MLSKDVRPNLDGVVRTEPKKRPIKRRVMQGTKREAVSNNRLTFRMTVRHDVRGVEQLRVTKTAECALLPVRLQYTFPKGPLVEPHSDRRCYVRAPDLVTVLADTIGP